MLGSLSILCWLFIMSFNGNGKFKNVPRRIRGGGDDDDDTTPAPTTGDIAQQTLTAKQATDPASAQLSFDIASGPAGVGATTQLLSDVRGDVFGEESAVKSQLLSNILSSLQAPTGITPEQQSAQEAIRGRAQGQLQQALRQRAELGGGLFGGRAAGTEERAVSELQQAFSAEDIGREERARLNAQQSALQSLSLLLPQIGLSSTPFQSAVASPGSAFQAATTSRGQDINQQIAEEQARAQIISSLFQAVGTVGGAAAGKPG